MTRILITGIAGHLGSRFTSWLLENVPGVEIVGLDNLSCGYRENVPAGVEFVNADLLDLPHGAAILADYVFHFAAYAAECLSPFIRRYNVRNNWEATTALINAVLNGGGCKRFVFTSSMSVYGRGVPPFDEADTCNPIDPYAIAKRAAELDLMAAGEQHGLPWTIIRPHNLYGPGQSIWQKYRNVFGIWMSRYLQGLPLLVYGDGMQQRAFSYIDDCLPCLWAAATRDRAEGQIINLGGEQEITLRAAAKLLADVMGGAKIEHRESRHEVKRAWCTVEKSQRLLGYVERTNLEQGLREMWAWAREAWIRYPERRWTYQVTPIEVKTGLYSYWKTRDQHRKEAVARLPEEVKQQMRERIASL